ncbi:MAG: GNAT family N-acetyltransferase [Cyclobacteriaceae bacterium]
MKIISVTPENVSEHGLFCIKDKKSPGFKKKLAWFQKRFEEGLKFRLIQADDGGVAGFIEYIPSQYAWRPVDAKNYLFIHCIMMYPNKYKGHQYGTRLVQSCLEDAKKNGKAGVAVMTSKGTWMADQRLFLKNGFKVVDKKDRFELLAFQIKKGPEPKFYDWPRELKKYKGWHLVYSDQCPWHDKAAEVLSKTAAENNIELKVKKLATAKAAQKAPTGFGVFNLVKDGKVLADHYISETRFKNILKKELVDYDPIG